MQISVLLAEQIAELFLMILMGYVIVKLGLVTDDDSKILSKIVLYIVIPCGCFGSFASLIIDSSMDYGKNISSG